MKVTDSPLAWRAVAHPVRRRLIELLGAGPRTTGDLARAFPVSRFAVMKHLRTLERSGIITVDRRGRECWNTLTTGGSLELTVAEASSATGVAQGSSLAPKLLPFRIERRILLSAPPSRVFDALTFNVSAWWGSPYLRSPSATNMLLEPQLGGRLFEEWGHRQGFIRGIVTAIRQDERLEVAGRIAGTGCLPAVLELDLRHSDRGTRLTLVHRGIVEPVANTPSDARVLYERAWDELVAERLKAFVELGVRSGIAERPAPEGALLGWF
jgi:DNA-binding transcriptional ArsR family regulator/uncharacterized protein YndB with AHSA1/START domain